MSNVLESLVDNRRLRFGDNLRVQELDNAGAVLNETDWKSLSDEKENEISFRFPDETNTSLAVKYAFNDRNQLTLQIVEQPGVAQASGVWTLPGKIVADDMNDIEYFLLDEAGSITKNKIEIYATLDFTKGNDNLSIKFPDGTETVVAGAKKARSLSASANFSGGDLTSDILQFTAFTRNTVDGEIENMPVAIKFRGRWDLHENALVFVTKYDNSAGGTPVGYIALAGKIKGTEVGLIVEQDGTAALQIHGRYSWNKNTLGWDLNVGYSKSAGIEARVAAGATIVGAKGTLTFKGGATLKKGKQGVDLKLDLSLDYTTKNGHITFSIQGDGQGYEAQLSGDFQIRNGNVNFLITASDKNGKKTVTGTVAFGFYTKNVELKLALEATLTPNGISLKLDLEFELSWGPDGKPVAELP